MKILHDRVVVTLESSVRDVVNCVLFDRECGRGRGA